MIEFLALVLRQIGIVLGVAIAGLFALFALDPALSFLTLEPWRQFAICAQLMIFYLATETT